MPVKRIEHIAVCGPCKAINLDIAQFPSDRCPKCRLTMRIVPSAELPETLRELGFPEEAIKGDLKVLCIVNALLAAVHDG